MCSLKVDGEQRYRTVVEICRRLGVGQQQNCLDVGGGTGNLGTLLGLESFTTLDVVGGGPKHVRGSMDRLPFSDEAFDLVLQVDSLEHLQPKSRAAALMELARVSRRWVICMVPVNGPGTVAVEEDLCRVHSQVTKGREMDWLEEHRRYGLPEEGILGEVLGTKFQDWVVWPSGSLLHYWVLKRLDLAMEAGVYQPEIEAAIDEWFSEWGWRGEYRTSGEAYRRVFVGTKEGELPAGIDDPPERDDSLSGWQSFLPIIEAITKPSQLDPDGQARVGEAVEAIERIASILNVDKKGAHSDPLWSRITGKGRS